MQVSKVLLAQMESAASADVCDLLEIFASAYWHPSLPVLNAAQDKLEACCSDLQLVNLCTSLWSFAIFAFVPQITLQRVYATRIEQEIEDLNPFQLCSVLWVFALFRSCTVGVWNTLVSKLGTFDVNDIDESALRYFYQVYMFIRASANTINLDAYRMPQRLLTESDKAWRLKKREESRDTPTKFDLDVKRVLGLLQFKDVQMKVRQLLNAMHQQNMLLTEQHSGLRLISLSIPQQSTSYADNRPRRAFHSGHLGSKPRGCDHVPEPGQVHTKPSAISSEWVGADPVF